MSTLSEVARRAGVSVSVASRVLSGDPAGRASAETRERIRRAALELNYRPNVTGRALRLARTDLIALIVPDVTNALFADLTRGVEDEALARGQLILLGRTEAMEPDESAVDRLLAQGRVDGIILQPGDAATAEEVAPLLAGSAPVVTIHQLFEGASSVLVPDADAAAAAVHHLAARGHRRIGFVGGLPASATAQRRADGFWRAVAEAGIEARPEWVSATGYRTVDGRAGLAHILQARERPTAVVVANVNAAVGVLAEARERGIVVPDALSVIAIHDSATAEHTWPPLTCIRLPLYEMGRAAVAALAERRAGGAIDHRVVGEPAPRIVERDSVRDQD